MANSYFQFRQFRIEQQNAGMKVTTDACLFGAWVVSQMIEEPQGILDIGTGTGLLSLMLAQSTKNSQIDAVEIDALASAEARDNFQSSHWKGRMNVHHVSIEQFVQSARYDLIISNPPFFESSQRGESASRNKALHETTITQRMLCDQTRRLLLPGGRLFVLYPEREMTTFEALVSDTFHCTHRIIVRNRREAPVFRIMASFQFSPTDVIDESEIVIRHKDNRYTNEFWALLHPFYLEYNDPNQNKE